MCCDVHNHKEGRTARASNAGAFCNLVSGKCSLQPITYVAENKDTMTDVNLLQSATTESLKSTTLLQPTLCRTSRVFHTALNVS
jgi:hypothetical protein